MLEAGEGKRPQRSSWWTLFVAPIGLALLTAVAAIQDTLLSPIPLGEMISHDLKATFVVVRDPTIPEFPLLRDTASLAIVALLLLCLPQLSKQWRLIESLWPSLVGSRIIYFKDDAQAVKAFSRCNDRFRRIGEYSLGVFVVALALALTLVIGQKAVACFEHSALSLTQALENSWVRIKVPYWPTIIGGRVLPRHSDSRRM